MTGKNLILVIENKRSANNLSFILSKSGYLVLSAVSFDIAINIIRTRKPVLLVCDDVSEKSESVEICRQLRAEKEIILPVVCLVGAEISHTKQIYLKLQTGADKYIQTPFEPLEFIKIITVLIEGQTSKNSLEHQDIVFRSLIESITDIITVITIDGSILYESPSVEKILGREPVDSLGANAFEWIHPDDRQTVIDYILTADLEEAAKGIDYRIKHQNGTWRIFHSIGRFNKSIFKKRTVLITSRDVTDRRLLNERHHIVLKKAQMVWWEWTPSLDEIITSDNFTEIYGLPDNIKNSIEGFDLIHPEDVERHREVVEKIAKSGGAYHSEFRIIRRDNNKIIWLEETATAILNSQNKIDRIVGIATDISERKKAESDLRESEEKFKSLFKGIPIPIYIWEKIEKQDDFVLVESNDAGVKPEALFSSSYFGMKSTELLKSVPEILNGLKTCIKEKRIVHSEAEFQFPTTAEQKIVDLYFVNISPTLVMAVSRDITQAKFAEAERAELIAQIEFQNQRLNDIITSIPGAVWETNIISGIPSQSTGFVSEYIEKMTDYTKEEWLSHPNFWLEIIHPDDRRQVVEKINEILEEKSEGSLEYRFITKSGQIIWTETQMKTVKNHLGEVVSLTGITIDVSERKKAEEALLKSEEQLRQSQRLESVGRLAGGIAHDFNNMLTAINGYSELILRQLDEENPVRSKVLEIKKAGERSADLTQQLLAFSRRQILKPQKIDINHIINDISILLRRLIGEHIVLNIELDENACRVEADPGQLSQVIMNLAVNARDAMPKGGELIIKTENVYFDQEDAKKYAPTIPGDYVLLSVKDTGIGLDDENIEHIFEPFYTTREKGAGTGLGLATVYGIVKQSGGYIFVESKSGEGAVFDIYLPRINDEVTVLKEDTKIETNLNGNETILLVEDEQAVRELIVKILEIYGYRVIEANNGVDALEIFKTLPENISLLITDIVMPRMNGRDLAEKIKKINPEVQVLYSSGYSDDREMMPGMLEKDVSFINKPFTPEELGERVRQLLDRKK